MEPPVPQEPASTAAVKPNVPGRPPTHRPWYASPWVFAALVLLFLAAVTYVTRELDRPAPGDPSTPVTDTAAVHR